MIEIKLLVMEKIVKETLSRIGIGNFDAYILYPSAYLIRLEGNYYIASFKELFKFINPLSFENFTDSDRERLNSICWLLEKWGLIECIDNIDPHSTKIDCIKFEDKKQWAIRNKIKIRNLESILG